MAKVPKDLTWHGDQDTDTAVIKFVQIECRCGAKSGVERDVVMDSDPEPKVYDWQTQHNVQTGHQQFYVWRLERGTSRVYHF